MAKARKGVVPPQLRPYLFKRGGGRAQSPAGKRSRPYMAARAAPKKAMGVIGRVKKAVAKAGGLGTIYCVVNAGNELQVVTKAQNAMRGGVDEAIGQAKLLVSEALGSKAAAIGTPIAVYVGGKWALRQLGLSVPDWV